MEEITLELPKHFVQQSTGFAYDVGNSAMKVVYRHKDDWQEFLQQKGETNAKVRLRIFPIEKVKEAILFLKENCYISKKDDISNLVYGTGISGASLEEELLNVFGVKTEILFELDLFVKAFHALSNRLTMEKFEYIPSEEFKDELRQIVELAKISLSRLLNFTVGKNASSALTLSKLSSIEMNFCDSSSVDPITKTIPDMFPCLLYLISSGTIVLLIKGEDDFQYITPAKNGGRIFLGQGALICGAKKTYDELIDMAESGDNLKVDTARRAILPAKGLYSVSHGSPSDLWTQYLDEMFFSFGEVAKSGGADSFNQEDLIRSLLLCTIRYHVDSMLSTLVASGARHIFVAGSFTNRELVRKMMYKDFARNIASVASTYGGIGKDCHLYIHFVKAAAYLGSIGAFMHSGAK